MNNEEKILEMLAGLTETVGKLSEGQSEMRSDIKQINGRLDRLENDVSELKASQAAMQATQAEHGAMLKELDARSLKSAVLLETDVARDTHLLYEGHSELKRELDTLATKKQVEKLSEDVDVIKAVVTRHSGDISRLKKAQ